MRRSVVNAAAVLAMVPSLVFLAGHAAIEGTRDEHALAPSWAAPFDQFIYASGFFSPLLLLLYAALLCVHRAQLVDLAALSSWWAS
jgi:hypothetical protein